MDSYNYQTTDWDSPSAAFPPERSEEPRGPLVSAAVGFESESLDWGGYEDGGNESVNAQPSNSAAPRPNSVSTSSALNENPDQEVRLFTSITVTEPRKEEIRDVHVSYLVMVKCGVSSFGAPWFEVRRRYQDFLWLHQVISSEYPQCIVAPLPEKHRMGYITGDRFGTQFLEKRRASLERFMRRMIRHPVIQHSPHLKAFVTESVLVHTAPQIPERDTILENIGDTILNAFTKVQHPDKRFIDIEEAVNKLEENLGAVERMYQKVTKREMELHGDYAEFGKSVADLANLEKEMSTQLVQFSQVVDSFAHALRDKATSEEHGYVLQLKDYIVFCQSVKNVLRLRDQKQIDYEQLSEYLRQHQEERDRLEGESGSGGIASFIKDKYDEMTGVDIDQARREKLNRLREKVEELQQASNDTHDISVRFSREVLREFSIFQAGKVTDMREFLGEYAENQAEFYRKGATMWEDLVPILERLEIDE